LQFPVLQKENQNKVEQKKENCCTHFNYYGDRSAFLCFIKSVDDKPIGFAQCQLRHDYVEGTESSPVGYLEGVFVSEGYRKKGYAAELLSECEKWAKERGCTEFASDCELDNIDSLSFHMALGFEEVNRIICFRKDL
jgi:aminoglycoside 6'-N-acetyltransferase I